VLTEALAVAAKVASKAPVATRFAKQAVNKSLDLSLEDGLALEANLFALLSATQDKVEAAQAFKEKRAPKFIGA
jgi:enoyl-CoA hydratase/carnithine racemase